MSILLVAVPVNLLNFPDIRTHPSILLQHLLLQIHLLQSPLLTIMLPSTIDHVPRPIRRLRGPTTSTSPTRILFKQRSLVLPLIMRILSRLALRLDHRELSLSIAIRIGFLAVTAVVRCWLLCWRRGFALSSFRTDLWVFVTGKSE